MSTNLNTAKQFFEACETGKGWESCSNYCHPNATFSSQTTVLADVTTLEAYCNWMKDLFTPVPDGHRPKAIQVFFLYIKYPTNSI